MLLKLRPRPTNLPTPSRHDWLLGLLALLGVMLLYGAVVRLPFYSDDIEFYTYLATISPLEIFAKADANGLYWRPIPQLLYYVLPPHAPTWHSIVLWTHLLNVALVGALARHLRLRGWATLAAMGIMAAFPFSVQAVAWVLSWGHVLSTTMILACVLCALKATSSPSLFLTARSDARRLHIEKGAKPPSLYGEGMRVRLLFAVVFGCLAPFTHENGILVAPVLVLFLLWKAQDTRTWRSTLRTSIPLVLPIILVSVGYWLYRASLVRSQLIFDGDLLERIVRYLAYFAQGISFPIQVAMNALEGDSVARIWLGTGIMLLLASVLLLRARQRRYWLLALLVLAWWLGASMPTVLALPSSYNLLYDERVLYVSSPAVALFFGLIVATLWGQLRVITSLALVGSMAVVASLYIGLFSFMGGAWNSVFAQVRQLPSDTNGLILNFPRFMEYSNTLLPQMRPNAMMMQIEFTMRDVLWTNTRAEFPNWRGVAYVEALQHDRFPFALDVWNHYIGYGDFVDNTTLGDAIRERDAVIELSVDGQYHAQLRGVRTPASDNPTTTFGDVVALHAVTLENNQVSLTWEKVAPIDQPLIAFVHRLCEGDIAAQSDLPPLHPAYSLERWQVGEAWREVRELNAPNTCTTLRVGIYWASNGQPLMTENGEAFLVVDETQ